MRDGKIAQMGTPEEVYESPSSPSIAVSTGDALVLDAQKFSNGSIAYAIAPAKNEGLPSETGFVVIRPEEIAIGKAGTSGVSATLIQLDYYGHDAMLVLKIANDEKLIRARISGAIDFKVGDTVSIEHQGPVRFFATL
jgi:iron(III) transport system ATP-binding protein